MRLLVTRLWNSPTFTTWGSVVLKTATGVITTPLLVTRLHAPEIAIWYLYSSIIGLQALFEMALSASFVRAVAYAQGGATDLATGTRHPDDAGGGQSLQHRICITMRWIYSRLAVVLACLLGVGGSIALMRPIAAVESESHAWMAWAIIVVGTATTFRNIAATAFLSGMNRIPELRRVEISGALTAVLLNAIVLLAGGGLLLLALTTQTCLVAASEWNRRRCLQLEPAGFTARPAPDRSIVSAIWPPTWRSGIGVLMSQGVLQMSAILYAQLGTPAEVATLLFSMRVLQILMSMCQAPFYSKLPLLARLHAEGNSRKQLQLAAKGMAFSYWIYVVGVVSVAMLMHRILPAIGSHVAFIDSRLWYLIGIAYFVERYGAMHIQLYSLTNKIIWHRANGVSGLIYLLVLSLTYPMLGLYAFPAAVLAGNLGFYSWYSALHSYRHYQLRFWQFEGPTSLFPAMVLLLMAVLSA